MLADHLLKTKKEFKETGDTNYIYKKELDKACFQHGMAYRDFKGLARRTASDKVLRDIALILLKILNVMDIKGGLLLCFINFLIKSLQAAVLICIQIMSVL